MKRILSFILPLMIILSASEIHAETTLDRLVRRIVTGRESDDDKVYKIEKWVNKNVQYRRDKEQFNMDDRTTLPLETLQRRKGDCEDGAILLMTLAVTAGVPREKLRLYAPIVTKNGLHASVAYQRETDQEWVWVEWTMKWPHNIELIQKRPTIKEVYSFIPNGYYWEVTSVNPFKVLEYLDEEMKERAEKILKQNNKPDN